MTKLPTVSKVFLALVILCLSSGVLPGQPKEAPKTITLPALLQSSETVEIYSLATGHLGKQNVDIGDKVKMGQILAEIDAPILVREVQQAVQALELAKVQLKVAEAFLQATEASVKEARNRIDQREGDLLAARANVKHRLQEFKRFKELFQSSVIDQRIVDEQTEKKNAAEAVAQAAQAVVLQARNDMEVKMALVNKAKAEVEVQQVRIRAHQTALEIAQVRLGYTKIIAPFEGVITRHQFSNGELIRAADHGRPSPLFVLQRMDRMRVIIQVPEKSAHLVQAGAKVELTIPSLAAGTIQGTIARTSVALEEGNMRAEMDVANTAGNLRPGMTGKATIHLDKGK